MMDLTEDRYCMSIVGFLSAIGRKIRFNKMYKNLNALGAKMSKPTLIEHLKHLLEKEYILREEEDKQTVTYQINWEKFPRLADAIDIQKAMNTEIKNKERFNLMSLQERIVFVTLVETMKQLMQLQLAIISCIEPKAETANNFGAILLSRLFTNYRGWLLESCKSSSKETNQKAYDLLTKAIEEITAVLFGRNEEEPKN